MSMKLLHQEQATGNNNMIDLHFHSTFSDGSLTPTELVKRADRLGLTGLSLTDHDCTFGVPEFMDALKETNITGISGVELSIEVPKGTFHLLGYMFDIEDSNFQKVLDGIRGGREVRNVHILEKINMLGMGMTWEEVEERAGEGVVGRPHFAQVMINKGYVSNKQEAFDKYLAKGKPAYFDRMRLFPIDGIKAIREAGGIAVLAHPMTLALSGVRLFNYISELKDNGLQGMEVYYSEHSNDYINIYNDIAKRLDLVASGGSDFHGDLNPNIELGRGFGNLSVPDSVLEELRELGNFSIKPREA